MERQKRSKSIRSRILALTLALLTAFTALPSQTAYADSVGGNVSGGGTGGMGATTDAKAWSSNDQGYRFYLVDENFNRVTDIYDFYFSTPTKVGELIFTTRFDSSSSPSGRNLYSIQELARLTQQSVTSIPKPVQNNKGQGVEFKKWFLKNIKGSGGIINSGSSGSNKGHTGSSSGNHAGGNSSGSSSSSGSNNSTSTVPPEISSVYNSPNKSVLSKTTSEIARSMTDEEKAKVKKLKNQALTMAQTSYDLAKQYIGNGMSIDDAKAYAALKVRSMYKSDYTTSIANYLAVYVYGAVRVAKIPKTDESLLTQSIPLAKPDTEYTDTSTEGCPAMIFLQRSDSIQVAGYQSPFIAMKEAGYNLVIEPITWLHISTRSAYESYKTYGSYYNIARKWVSKGGKDSGSFYNSYMGSLGNNCLVVSRESKSMDGSKEIKPITSAVHRKISETVSLIEAGYGLSMHMYSSSDLNESGTHTYDPILGTLPGPAPDPSDLPQDSPDKGGNTITIIKNYVTETNGTEQTDGNYTRVKNPHTIEIEDEPNYKVVEWNTSTKEAPSIPDGSKTPWNEVIKTSTKTKAGTSSTTVELGSPEKVMYIKLKKADGISENPEVSGDWVLNESELTTSVSTGSRTTGIKTVYTYGALNDSCTVHKHEHERKDGTKYNTYTECNFDIKDSSYTFKRANGSEGSYSSIIAQTNPFTSDVNEISGDRGNDLNAGQIEVSGFDYKFIIYRGSDKLNTCGYRPTTDANQLFSPATSKTSITRKKTNYTENVGISLVDASPDLQTSSLGDEDCTDSDTAQASGTIDLAGTVAVKVYSGQPRTPDTNLDSTPLKVLTTIPNDKTAGRQVSSGGTISFNPYIRMTYQTLNSGKQDASVLSEYERQIIPNDYAEIKWTYTEGNLKIISQMFALDANLTKGDKEWNKKNQVLKGGATYSLTTPKPQEVYLTTYQTITEGTSRDNSKVTGNELSEASAKLNHQQFVAEAIQTYNSTNVQQYVNKNTSAKTAWDNGVAVTNGSDISSLGNGSSTASTESKYYLKDDVDNKSNASRADLDVRELGTTATYYRFSSDTSGNIYMKSGDSVASVNSDKGERILTKTQDASSLIDKEATKINQRTGIVDKLVAAIERNTGNDTTASWASTDGHWYNEAYEGVIVMVQNTKIEIKFDTVAKRTTVLDPKLIPKLNSTSGQNLTAFLTQYNTDLDSTTPIATFKGNEIYMKDAELLFNSNKVYITNSTVQQ